MDTTLIKGPAQLALPILKHIPSPNFSSRNGRAVSLIVVHDCEGSYDGARGWFADPKSQVSAHIVLREDGQEATQMVDFADKAWHACEFNSISIGLELGGYAAKGFGAPEWQAAANVVAYLLHKFGLPPNWAQHGQGAGFCSHYDLGKAGGGHSDPTTNPAIWSNFVALVKAAYALTPPTAWAPAPFVPTPTVRKD